MSELKSNTTILAEIIDKTDKTQMSMDRLSLMYTAMSIDEELVSLLKHGVHCIAKRYSDATNRAKGPLPRKVTEAYSLLMHEVTELCDAYDNRNKPGYIPGGKDSMEWETGDVGLCLLALCRALNLK